MQLPARKKPALPSLKHWAVACAWLASMAAQAQFSMVPAPQPQDALRVSEALNEKAYRKDAARHIYGAYPSRILRGMLPPLLYAIMITETEVDSHGAVVNVKVTRAPAAAKEVAPWVVSLIRSAAPLPPPVKMGSVKFVEIWLVDKSGLFQVDSLTEGQL